MIATLLFSLAFASAQDAAMKPVDATYLLAFHADWCPKCAVLGPRVMASQPQLEKHGVKTVMIDRTSDKTALTTVEAAKKLGLDKIAAKFEGTGYGVFVNARDKRVVSTVTDKMTSEQIVEAAKVAAEKRKTKLYAVAFHADWCGKCQVLGPKVMGAHKQLMESGTELIKLDLTSDETKKAAEQQVKWLGIAEAYKANQATGFVLLIDPVTKAVVGRISSDIESSKLQAVVMEALAKVGKA